MPASTYLEPVAVLSPNRNSLALIWHNFFAPASPLNAIINEHVHLGPY